MKAKASTPAAFVISKFGSQSALARLLGKAPGTVQYWSKKGTIPVKWHAEILRLAGERSLDLNAADFTQDRSPESGSVETIPVAQYMGILPIGDQSVGCFVLGDGRRVISRTGATDVLTGKRGGGNLESYLRVQALKPYLPTDLNERMIQFTIPEVVNKTVRGMTAETFLDICKAYVQARNDGALNPGRQVEISFMATMFLAACSKVGLIALIDEATGYQYERAEEALQVKLRAYLSEEMRAWEKTFPDELWREFARLTNWKGAVTQRPRYWGKLVMELVYGYLDPDVADWLREHAPKPKKGQNYHQWLSSQYGLKKLVEHLWMLIGLASACTTMRELRTRMAEKYGRHPIQFVLYLDPPDRCAPPTPGPTVNLSPGS